MRNKMQQFQQFWHNKFSHLDSQLQLDYDTFISIFAEEIRNQTAIELTDLQKQIIKRQIDPENQNQVYKSGYLLFVKNFWGVASQRTKFFNMKLNLSKLKNAVDPLPMVGWMKIKVTYQNKSAEDDRKYQVIDEYQIKDDKISLLCTLIKGNPTIPTTILKQKPLRSLGFISLGSALDSNDICIPESSINSHHLKLIYSTNLEQQGKSTASFIVKPKPVNRAFIRDISTSNRTGYLIDDENNYFVVKAGMIVGGIGLIEGLFQLVVDSVPSVEPGEIVTLLQSLNADRKSFMIGEPDKPLKVATNWDMQPISQSLIADLYDRNMFYPQTKIKAAKIQSKDEKTKPPLKVRVINKRTLQEWKFDSKNTKYMGVGRDAEKCTIQIDHISVKPLQFCFQCINQIWFIRKVPVKSGQSIGLPAVMLSKDRNRCSNRLPICPEYPQRFRVRNNVEIEISMMDREKKNQEDDY